MLWATLFPQILFVDNMHVIGGCPISASGWGLEWEVCVLFFAFLNSFHDYSSYWISWSLHDLTIVGCNAVHDHLQLHEQCHCLWPKWLPMRLILSVTVVYCVNPCEGDDLLYYNGSVIITGNYKVKLLQSVYIYISALFWNGARRWQICNMLEWHADRSGI